MADFGYGSIEERSALGNLIRTGNLHGLFHMGNPVEEGMMTMGNIFFISISTVSLRRTLPLPTNRPALERLS